MNWIKRLFKKQTIVEPQTQALNIPVVSGRSEQFSCPLPDARCDRHKIDDEEGRWEFCNTCKRECKMISLIITIAIAMVVAIISIKNRKNNEN